jgi:hypothetical protein
MVIRTSTIVLALLAVHAATFLFADRLRFEPVKDEIHFLESARVFAAPFGWEELRGYPEVVTPLALVVWGGLERLTGDGLWAGRCLNLAVSLGLLCLIALPWGAPARGARCAVGLLAFPYTLALAVHLYTDLPAAALGALGVAAVLSRRAVPAALSLSAAIAVRQYLVQIPAAMAAAELLAWRRGDRGRWRTAFACALAVATLGGWIAFFGGLAPAAGLDTWIPAYPAPMLSASTFLLHQGLYALTGVGAYFVVVEAALFRQLPPRSDIATVRSLALALALAGLFLVDPPVLTASHPGGPIGRASRLLLPSPGFDAVRVGLYYVLALAAVLRFSRKLDAAFWIVAAGAVLAMKQQIPWEKYLFPTLSALWLLRASGSLAPYGADDRTDSTSKSFRKQSSPTPGFST